MECLETLVGLSQTTCECYPTPPPGYNDSDSGLYIDEAKGFNLDFVDTQNECKKGGLWDIMANSRDQAITQLQMDLNKCLNIDKKSRYKPCKGAFISTKQRGTSLTTDFIAIKLDSKQREGTCLNIKSLGLMASSAGTIDWFIYSNQDFTAPLHSGSFAVVGSGVNTNLVDINLDLEGEDCVDLCYYIVYQLNGVTTKSNQIWCKPCSGRDQCTEQFYCQNGLGGDDIGTIESWTDTGNLANGMLYSGEIVCVADICDYLISEKNKLYMWIATALQMKAAECIYYNLITSSDYSKYTQLDLDCLQGVMIDYKNWYDEALEYVCQEITKQGHPCLRCDDPLKRFTIYA